MWFKGLQIFKDFRWKQHRQQWVECRLTFHARTRCPQGVSHDFKELWGQVLGFAGLIWVCLREVGYLQNVLGKGWKRNMNGNRGPYNYIYNHLHPFANFGTKLEVKVEKVDSWGPAVTLLIRRCQKKTWAFQIFRQIVSRPHGSLTAVVDRQANFPSLLGCSFAPETWGHCAKGSYAQITGNLQRG